MKKEKESMTKWEKVRCFINKIFAPVMTLLILLVSVWFVTIVLMGGKWYYHWQFEKNHTEEKLSWSYIDEDGNTEYMSYDGEDLNEIGDAIVEYLMGKRDTMQVVIDEKNVFSNQALKHMDAVKRLIWRWTYITIALFILMVLGFVYMSKYFDEIREKLFKKTWITYASIGGVLLIVAIFMIVDFDWTFTMFHHILFPNPIDFRDAFFGRISYYEEYPYINNYLLILVLSIEVFMDAAWIILSFIVIMLSIWFTFTLLKSKKYNKNTEELALENK